MTNMPPATQPRGLRRSTSAGRSAAAAADRYDGLPPGITRWRLAAALRAAACPLGLTASMLRLLELYIDLSYDQDWEAGAEPVITRPLVEIAEHLGRSERQVRNIERALVERGLLAWRDSGNHHRKGRRDRATGRLIYAYGPSLAPVGARAMELIALAQEARSALAARRRLRIAIAALRRRIRCDIAAAALLGHPVATFEQKLAALSTSPKGDLRDVETLHAMLSALAEQLDSCFATETRRAPELEISRMQEIEGRDLQDTSKRSSMNGGRRQTRGDLAEVRMPHAADHGMTRTPCALAMMAASAEFRDALAASGRHGWSGVADAAGAIVAEHGIDRTLWADACMKLGRSAAATAVIIVDQAARRSDGAPHARLRDAQAYFRAMIARGQAGGLRLDRSIRSLAVRAAPSNTLTGEPLAPSPGRAAGPP